MSGEGCGGGDLFGCCRDLGASFICQSEPICGTIMRVVLVRHDKDACDKVVLGCCHRRCCFLRLCNAEVAIQDKRVKDVKRGAPNAKFSQGHVAYCGRCTPALWGT